MPIPSSDRLWVTLPTAEKFALEFAIFRLTLVPLGKGVLTVTNQPQRLRSRVREMSCFCDSTLITSTALRKGRRVERRRSVRGGRPVLDGFLCGGVGLRSLRHATLTCAR